MATLPPTKGDINTIIYRFQYALRAQFLLVLIWAIVAARASWCKGVTKEGVAQRLTDLVRKIQGLPLVSTLVEQSEELKIYAPIYFERALVDNSVELLNNALTEAATSNPSVKHCAVWLTEPVVAKPHLVAEYMPLLQAWAEAEQIVGKFVNPAKHLSLGVQPTQGLVALPIYFSPNQQAVAPNVNSHQESQQSNVAVSSPIIDNQSTGTRTGQFALESTADVDMRDAPQVIADPNLAPNVPMSNAPPNNPHCQSTSGIPAHCLQFSHPPGQSVAIPTPVFVASAYPLNHPIHRLQCGEAVFVEAMPADFGIPPHTSVPAWFHEIHRFHSALGYIIITREAGGGPCGSFCSSTIVLPLAQYAQYTPIYPGVTISRIFL